MDALDRGGARRVLLTLLLDHGLILGGAFPLVLGAVDHRPPWLWLGVALVLAGVAVEAVVLTWSARLVRRGSRTPAPPGPTERRAICLGCGWTGVIPKPASCPRCHRPTTGLG